MSPCCSYRTMPASSEVAAERSCAEPADSCVMPAESCAAPVADWLAPDVYWLMPDTRLEPPVRIRLPLAVIWYSPSDNFCAPGAAWASPSDRACLLYTSP